MGTSVQTGYAQTVLGPVSPDYLGITLPHEHMLIDQTVGGVYFVEPTKISQRALAHQPVSLENLSWVRYNMKDSLDNQMLLDEAMAVKEASLYRILGGQTIVDQTNVGIGRDPEALVRISRATGLNIVMGSGYYVDGPLTEAERNAKTEGEIAAEIIRDVTVGVDDTGIRSGMIGELGCSWPLKPNERKGVRAGAIAQRATGAPINIHPGRNEGAPLEIMNVLREAGADLSRVVMSHMDRCGFSLETRQRLLDTGCFIEYDVFGLEGYYPAKTALAEGHLPDTPNDVERIRQVRQLIEMGFVRQILLSQDVGMKIMLVSYGGGGYGHLLREVVPLMRIYGIGDDDIHTMMVENPKRLLTFV